jgi:hypothetical protein
MSHTVRDTRTVEWAVVVATGQRTVQETQHDSRMVFISQGLPLEMKKATNGRNAIVFRPDLLTMRWTYRKHHSRNEWQWELRDIELTGPRILNNGKASKQQITNGYWIGQDHLPRFIEELAEKYHPDGDHPFTVDFEPVPPHAAEERAHRRGSR